MILAQIYLSSAAFWIFGMIAIAAAIAFGDDLTEWIDRDSNQQTGARELAREEKRAELILKHGLQPIRNAPLNLHTDEVCYYYGPARLVQLRKARGTGYYHGPVLRIPIASGLDYRAAVLKGGFQLHENWREVDEGRVYITNERIVYRGRSRNNSAYLSNVLSIRCYPGGEIRIDKPNGSPFVMVGCETSTIRAVLEELDA